MKIFFVLLFWFCFFMVHSQGEVTVFSENKDNGMVLYAKNIAQHPISIELQLNLINAKSSKGEQRIFVVQPKTDKVELLEVSRINSNQRWTCNWHSKITNDDLSLKSNEPIYDYSAVDKKVSEMYSRIQTTDALARYVNINFTTDIDKTRAIFMWLANNIAYDVESAYAKSKANKNDKQRIENTLSERKGVCGDYSLIFRDVCTKVGVKCFCVNGYTKNGGITPDSSHTWCVAMIDSAWFIFEPTWAAGGINNGRFFKKLNTRYFKMSPEEGIKKHMPYDCMWQLLHHPITFDNFNAGKTDEDLSRPYFDYYDSIKAYENSNPLEKLLAVIRRIEQNGSITTPYIDTELIHLKNNVAGNLCEKALEYFREAAEQFTCFFEYRNLNFPGKTDVQISGILNEASQNISTTKHMLAELKSTDERLNKNIKNNMKSANELELQINQQRLFLDDYLKKPKSERRAY